MSAELIELYRKERQLKRELREVERQICGLTLEGHTFRHYVEWSNSGDECSKCGRRVKKFCHYAKCECELEHHK